MLKLLSPRSRRTGVLLILLLIGLLAEGCGNPKGIVSGVVTYQGQPLKSGFVTFIPERGSAVHSSIDTEGKYRVENVPVGSAKITVETGSTGSVEALKEVKNPKSPEEMKKVMMPRFDKQSKLPKIYSDPQKSGQSYTVLQGPQNHNIDLK